MAMTLLAIAVGAAVGAMLRFGLGSGLNHFAPNLPMGTLIANLLGAFLMGMALAAFLTIEIPATWRLFLTTGFLGGLTTFSTFSAEAFLLMQQGQTGAAVVHIVAHVAGSLISTAAGFHLLRSLAP